MKRTLGFVATSLLLLASCASYGPYYVSQPFGVPRPYGRHPGVDFEVNVGTPVIAPSDGQVTYVGRFGDNQPWHGGFIVVVSHGEHSFFSAYIHLSAVHVESGHRLKRGELVGLSGAPNMGWAHLHFGICKIGGGCTDYSTTYNPEEFWLGGKPQCFDPRIDYSRISARELTLPLACGDYAKDLVARIKTTGSK